MNKMKKVFPSLVAGINDGDLAKRLKKVDPSNIYDMEFIKDLSDEYREKLGHNFSIAFMPSKDLTSVLMIAFDEYPSDTAYPVYFTEDKIPYIIVPEL